MTPVLKKRILWGLFILMAVCGVVPAVCRTAGYDSEIFDIANGFVFKVPVLFLLLYSAWTLGTGRALMLIGIVFVTSSAFEFGGIQSGALFGGHYVYHQRALSLGDLPLFVPLYWAGLIFIAYSMTSSFLMWMGRNKPCRSDGALLLLFLLTLLDGSIVAGIGLVLDPLASRMGEWSWSQPGPFYGSPLLNAPGWCVVGIVSTGLFRIGEYLWPGDTQFAGDALHVIPALAYGLLCFGLITKALQWNEFDLAVICFFVMFPVTAANLLLYVARKGTDGNDRKLGSGAQILRTERG